MEFVKYCPDNRLVSCQHFCVQLFLCFKTKSTEFSYIFCICISLYNNIMNIDRIYICIVCTQYIQDVIVIYNRMTIPFFSKVNYIGSIFFFYVCIQNVNKYGFILKSYDKFYVYKLDDNNYLKFRIIILPLNFYIIVTLNKYFLYIRLQYLKTNYILKLSFNYICLPIIDYVST